LMIALAPMSVLQAQETPAPPPAPDFSRGRGGGGSRGDVAPARDTGARGGAPRISRAAPGVGPTCTFDATIYDVRLPSSQIGRLDMDALTKAAANADSFEKALAELGATRPLYRANQSVRLAGDSISIGTTVPYVSSTHTTNQGNPINTVTYSNVGALFDLVGSVAATGNIELDMSMQVSALGESPMPIANDAKAPFFRKVTMARKGPVPPNQPFVVMSIDASSVDSDGKAVAYFARVILGTPQPGASPAGGE
jgi:hypothetical protein